MEQAAHVWCWGFLFHRWRICVVCVVCLALFLSALLAFFFSSMPRDDDSTWLHRVVFRYPSQNSSSMATTDWGAGARANLFDDPSLELNESVSGAATPGVGERGSGKYFYSAAAGDVAAREVVAPSSPRASAPNHGTVIENRASADAFWDGGSAATEQCDMSVGRWVQDATNYPLYKPGSCPFVDEAFRCQENGRPDSDYLKWRWKPKDCEIPRFNAQNVLERLRGKRLVFAGDSLMRNQWESMLCLLRGGLANESRMLEMRGHHITKGKGDYVFKFLDYNARVEFYRSHFLVAEGKQSRAGSRKARLTLRLDTMDKTARKWRQADVLVFTTGHWWTHGKTAKGLFSGRGGRL